MFCVRSLQFIHHCRVLRHSDVADVAGDPVRPALDTVIDVLPSLAVELLDAALVEDRGAEREYGQYDGSDCLRHQRGCGA